MGDTFKSEEVTSGGRMAVSFEDCDTRYAGSVSAVSTDAVVAVLSSVVAVAMVERMRKERERVERTNGDTSLTEMRIGRRIRARLVMRTVVVDRWQDDENTGLRSIVSSGCL